MSLPDQSIDRRLRRRELHHSRSATTLVVLVLAALVCAEVALEAILAAAGQGPLLASPAQMLAALQGRAGYPVSAVVTAAVVAAVVGLALVLVAVLPAHRDRRSLPSDRLVVIVDDDVLAGDLADATRSAARVHGRQTRIGLTRRRATVEVTPTSGMPVDGDAVARALEERMTRLAPTPPVAVRVRVTTSGVVGP